MGFVGSSDQDFIKSDEMFHKYFFFFQLKNLENILDPWGRYWVLLIDPNASQFITIAFIFLIELFIKNYVVVVAQADLVLSAFCCNNSNCFI